MTARHRSHELPLPETDELNAFAAAVVATAAGLRVHRRTPRLSCQRNELGRSPCCWSKSAATTLLLLFFCLMSPTAKRRDHRCGSKFLYLRTLLCCDLCPSPVIGAAVVVACIAATAFVSLSHFPFECHMPPQGGGRDWCIVSDG